MWKALLMLGMLVDSMAFELEAGLADRQLGLIETESEDIARGQLTTNYEGPLAFTVDDQGQILIADTMNVAIKKFSAEGKLLATMPMPHLDAEYHYTDIQTEGDRVTLLDFQNNWLLPMSFGSKFDPKNLIRIPKMASDKTPLITDRFRLFSKSRILLYDQQSASFFQIHPLLKDATGFNQTRVLMNETSFRPSFALDATGHFYGFRSDPKDVNRLQIVSRTPSGKETRIVTTTPVLEDLAGAEMFPWGSGFCLLAYKGGELETLVNQVLVYKFDGTLHKTIPLNLPQIPWKMNAQALANQTTLFVFEFDAVKKMFKIHTHVLN